MKKAVKIGFFVFVTLLLGIAGTGVWYVRTERFQEMMRSTLISQLEKATGMSCAIEYLNLDIFHGRFILKGVKLCSSHMRHQARFQAHA